MPKPKNSRNPNALPPSPWGRGRGRGIAGKDPPLPNFALPDFRRGSRPTAAPLVCQGRKKQALAPVSNGRRPRIGPQTADRRPGIPNGKRLPGCETRPAGQGSRRLVPPDRGGKGIDIRKVWGRPETAAGAVRALTETDIGDKNLYVKEKSEVMGNNFEICPNALPPSASLKAGSRRTLRCRPGRSAAEIRGPGATG